MVVMPGAETTIEIVTNFIRNARWVAVIPLPDNRFGIEVRPEHQASLNAEVERHLPKA
jgi:hypothetical protein